MESKTLYLVDPFCDIRTEDSFSPAEFLKLLESKYSSIYRHVRLDFALISLFAGNDYVPSLKFSAIPTLWKCYEEFRTRYPDEILVDAAKKDINVSSLQKFADLFVKQFSNKSIYNMYLEKRNPENKTEQITVSVTFKSRNTWKHFAGVSNQL